MAEIKDDGGPAFPTWERVPYGEPKLIGGMTLLDWFAGQALPARILAASSVNQYQPDKTAREAYEYADAMLKARQSWSNS